jgi:hypothetical protein
MSMDETRLVQGNLLRRHEPPLGSVAMGSWMKS